MKTRRLTIGAIGFAILAQSPGVQSQELRADPRVQDALHLLREWTDAQREYTPFPGISIAVVHDQELIWSEGLGYADLETMEPATPGTLYSICSISKLFTSIATMRVRDAGMLRLSDPVNSLLPWFRTNRGGERDLEVTVESLLTHSSGLPNGTGHSEAGGAYPTREELIGRVPELELLYRPRRDGLYSNLGLALAGEIVAELSGMTYERYVTDSILRPLGMSSTTPEIGDVWGSDGMATGYSAPRRGGQRLETDPFEARSMVPALGFASTVEDLVDFARWQFRVLAGEDDAVLSETTLREMYRVHQVDDAWEAPMGLGFTLIRDRGKTFVGHAGFCSGFQSNFALQPDERIAAIAASNSMIPIWTYTSVAYDLVAPAIRAALDDPGGGKAVPADFERFMGGYDLFPWSGEYRVVPWNGGLAALRLPAQDPRTGLRPLRHVEGRRFQAMDDGGWPSGDFVFDVDAEGNVVGVVVDGTPLPRLR
jgi:CubicO group peptidase (beta-lactamase class C family)